MKRKKWVLKNSSIDEIDIKKLNISKLTAKVLAARGYTSTLKALDFLNQKNEKLHSPFLLKDMEKAVAIIRESLKNNEKIVIYGDYDVDGVTSTSLLCHYFNEIGANVDFYIPERSSEGYGLNESAIKNVYEKGADLIITVDTGITAVAEVDFAKSLGMKIIITDHHSCKSELPNADAIINPKQDDCQYPYKSLAGVGVAFKLVCALDGDCDKILKKYSDMTAIGTIADVMPLTKENRTIVSHGIDKLKNTENVGLYALMEESSVKDVTSGAISFRLAPRLNAAGRMGHAEEAVRLILCNDMKYAKESAYDLCLQNTDRQKEEQDILNEVITKIENEIDLLQDKIIVVWGENWHHGVVGIVSSRIIEKYYLPVIIISIENGLAKGSARSIKGFNMFDALVSQDELLIKYGGHEMAAGMTLEIQNLPELRDNLKKIAFETITEDMLEQKLSIDSDLDFDDITINAIENLNELEPYGPSNPQPVFMSTDVEILDITKLSEGKHLKLTLRQMGKTLTALLFSVSMNEFFFHTGDKVDIAYNVSVNEFRDKKSPQIILKDIKISENIRTYEKNSIEIYNKFINDEKINSEMLSQIKPLRADFENAFKLIKRMPKSFDLLDFSRKIKINPAKALICFECFSETGLITYDIQDTSIRVVLNKPTKKVSLEDTNILKKLKER